MIAVGGIVADPEFLSLASLRTECPNCKEPWMHDVPKSREENYLHTITTYRCNSVVDWTVDKLQTMYKYEKDCPNPKKESNVDS